MSRRHAPGPKGNDSHDMKPLGNPRRLAYKPPNHPTIDRPLSIIKACRPERNPSMSTRAAATVLRAPNHLVLHTRTTVVRAPNHLVLHTRATVVRGPNHLVPHIYWRDV
jgi:hypothetical protein